MAETVFPLAIVPEAHKAMERMREAAGPLLDSGPSHRLVALFQDAERMVESLASPDSDGYADHRRAFMELSVHLDLLNAAKGQLSDWEAVMAACADPKAYDHFILILAVQNIIQKSWGDGVTAMLVPELADMRTPDLMVYRAGNAVAAVEVKSKDALKDAIDALPYAEAQKIVKKALAKTGNSTSGQLRNELPAFLAIGGFNISPMQMVLLKRAGAEWFKRNRGHRRSLAAILFVGLFIGASDGGMSIRPALSVEPVPNPGYTGKQIFEVGFRRTEAQFLDAFQRGAPDAVLRREKP